MKKRKDSLPLDSQKWSKLIMERLTQLYEHISFHEDPLETQGKLKFNIFSSTHFSRMLLIAETVEKYYPCSSNWPVTSPGTLLETQSPGPLPRPAESGSAF